MIVFTAHGHHNIKATHPTTIELTSEENVTLRGDCIIGIKAEIPYPEIKKLNGRFRMEIEANGISDSVEAAFNPKFSSRKEIVLRKSHFASGRTFGIECTKGAMELSRRLVSELKKDDTIISVRLMKK